MLWRAVDEAARVVHLGRSTFHAISGRGGYLLSSQCPLASSELRPWHYIYAYSIESRLIIRVRYDSHINLMETQTVDEAATRHFLLLLNGVTRGTSLIRNRGTSLIRKRAQWTRQRTWRRPTTSRPCPPSSSSRMARRCAAGARV